MNKDEAQKIAAAISILRPDWSTNGLMTVLADERCRLRPMRDVAIAFTALALDPESRKPTRIYARGHWWELLAPRVGTAVSYPVLGPDDCGICSRPKHQTTDHEYEPRTARGAGEKPTPEQRAAIEAVKEAAHMKATAAKEAAGERKRRSVEEVLAAHKEDQS